MEMSKGSGELIFSNFVKTRVIRWHAQLCTPAVDFASRVVEQVGGNGDVEGGKGFGWQKMVSMN